MVPVANSPTDSSQRPYCGTGLVSVVVLITAAILLSKGGSTGLLGDELLFVRAVNLGLTEGLCDPGSSHPPLMRMIVGSVTHPSSPDWLFRLPSILFSLLTVMTWSRILPRLIVDKTVQCLILSAMALNPVWLNLAFQCLPYSALTLFASLHCLAWFRLAERRTRTRWATLILTGSALPWTHFLGINVLLTDLMVWAVLWKKRQFALSEIARANLAIAGLTLAVVPIALFYLHVERPFPLVQIQDYSVYFWAVTSMIFSHITFSAFQTSVPLFVLLYIAVTVFVVRSLNRDWAVAEDSQNNDHRRRTLQHVYGIIAVGVFLSGFAAAQVHSVISQNATWPRYMLTGAWMHLPLIVFLMQDSARQAALRTFAAMAFCLAAWSVIADVPVSAVDYTAVSTHIKRNWRDGDAFLAQSMDAWQTENHFDQLWFRRYVSCKSTIVSGPFSTRANLYKDGLPLTTVDRSIQRIWVYSHLFRENWLKQTLPQGWRISSVHQAAQRFPLILLTRTPDRPPMPDTKTASQSIQQKRTLKRL